MARILIADDKKGMREVLAEALQGRGHRVEVVNDGDEAVRALQAADRDLVITDLRMPGRDGMEVLKSALSRPSPPSVIVMTAFGGVDAAVEAMRIGAADFVTKPFGLAEMEAKVSKALSVRGVILEKERLRSRDRTQAGRLVGEGAAMQAVRAIIAKVAPTPLPVLITGESGTGKELVAREIHDASPRADGPFVPVNCAALAEGVLESELFGHEKGAFTGSVATRRGKFEQASGGTLFLDEIGDVALPIQVKLLRFLQEKEIDRVGGDERIRVDARIVAATNRDVEEEIRAGRFREDLYYRLNVVRIPMPPLRDRLEDLPLLVEAVIRRVSAEIGRPVSVSDEARDLLPRWKWPGNVRELENVLARAAVLCEEGTISPTDMRLQPLPANDAGSVFMDAPEAGLEERVAAFEKSLIAAALKAEGGNQSRAAARLKTKRSSLQYKIEKYELTDRSREKLDADG